ncbi:G patch domain-containing protein 4 [Melitaea cinxia]|uniref:G patch domain-containing protein 4 n=1 Tax=Melitaea cinxia TaxID=113334 RepID=UPI001E27490B|nr:G patch domain-containing protein 4 [Melitaea cinxia]
MDFARKQLEKYGWSDGKGLGKNENGISEALKPKLKRSVTGIGYDAAADFTEHWWSALYDKAASNVQVEERNGKTKRMKRVDDKEFEITNSMWRLKRKNNNDSTEEYSESFVRTAVLGSGGSKTTKVKDSDSEEETDKKDALKLTDEELYAACEGRTAHKGARHGLRALGKLARIEQQEKQLLQQEKYNHFRAKNKSNDVDQVVEDTSLFEDTEVTKKKKKKKKRCNSKGSDNNDVSTNECNDNHINDNVDNECNERINNESIDVNKDLRKKRKKSKKKEIETIIEVPSDIEYELKCKKTRKSSTVAGEEPEVVTEVQIESSSKKNKKKKIDKEINI